MSVVLDFMSMLRYFGLPISPDETIIAQKTYQILGLKDKELIRLGLKVGVVKRKEDLHVFNECFNAFFGIKQKDNHEKIDKQFQNSQEEFERAKDRFFEKLQRNYREIDWELGKKIIEGDINQAIESILARVNTGRSAVSGGSLMLNELRDIQQNIQRTFRLAFGVPIPIKGLTPSQRQNIPIQTLRVAANIQIFEQGLVKRVQKIGEGNEIEIDPIFPQEKPERMSSTKPFLYQDLNFLSLQVANVKDQLLEIGRILASRERQRRKKAKRGRLDFRRTFRKNLANNGVCIDLVQKRKRIQDPEIIILNDVSGSTRWVAEWFFVISFAARSVFKKIRIFEFDNTMVNVTEALKKKTINRALEERQQSWKKTIRRRRIHSDYQSSLEDFFYLIKYRPLNRRTSVLILGDCRDNEGAWRGYGNHGKPISAELMHQIVLKTKRVMVLNPENMNRWDTGDSVVSYYRNVGVEIFHVSTLKDLIEFVFELKQN
ncbi:MAG: VWA domain-containing protein [Candidatus Hodarchaeota archaeon]